MLMEAGWGGKCFGRGDFEQETVCDAVINTQGLALCPVQKLKGSLVLQTQLGGGDVTELGFEDPIISVAVG